MAYLSANTLFHFTPKLKWLFNILEKGFMPRFCLENSLTPGMGPEPVHYAMVCFCDIKLSEVSRHQKMYGQCGIGMEKGWAVQKGINPVYYINRESLFLARFKEYYADTSTAITDLYSLSIDGYYKEGIQYMANEQPLKTLNMTSGENASNVNEKTKAASEASRKLVQFLGLYNHFKELTGDYARGNKVHKNYQYYDEKEWRYLPAEVIPEKSHYFPRHRVLSAYGGYVTKELKDKLNSDIETYGKQFHLTFKPEEIKYLIVKNDKEALQLINKLNILKRSRADLYNDENVKLLTTRIITCKQINEDF